MAYSIGSTSEVTALTELTVPIPESHRPQSSYLVKTEKLGSAMSRIVGIPVVEWRFPKITVAQRDQLKTYCPGASAYVYIRSALYENNDEEKLLYCIMEFPISEDRKAGFRFDLVIRFLVLEVIEEGSA